MDRLTKPKQFLDKLKLTDSDYQDNGMINHIADLLERYHSEQLLLLSVAVSVPTSTKHIFEVKDTGVKYVHKMTCEVIDGQIVMVDNGFVKVTDE